MRLSRKSVEMTPSALPAPSLNRPTWHPSSLWLLPLVVSGCASVLPTTSPAPALALPTHWSAPAPGGNTAPASSLAAWWNHFNDPLLSQLVTQALQANTSVASAQAALAQAQALRDVKGASLLPGVSASGSARRNESSNTSGANSFNAGLDASWNPDVFGGNRNGVNAAQADALAARESLTDVQRNITAELALAYIQLRGLQSQLQIARTNLASQAETLQITDWRAQAGLITSLEVAQARAATEQTGALIPTLQSNIQKTSHSLAVLTGQNPAALNAQLATPQAVPRVNQQLALSIPADTLRQRADVRAAEFRVSAALARVSVAEAARYPSFSIGGSVGLNALTLSGLASGATATAALLGAVSFPLFDGGATQAQVRAQSAALTQARSNYQATVLTALKEVEDALVGLQANRDRLVRLQAAEAAASQAAVLAQNRFASGLIDFQTVLQTQRTLLSTQDGLANTQADISADHVRLYKALGGGWV
jgi:multidrug efflux system outer membrane protein